MERLGTDAGSRRKTATVFLAGAECPFRCVFCDLWQYTVDGATPRGALPSQLSLALRWLEQLEQHESRGQPVHTLKLYNASNFFDSRAVPEEDDAALLSLAARHRQVTVECHPRMVGSRARMWSERLLGAGSGLEVALGLETANEAALQQMTKGANLDDYRRASDLLLEMAARIRVFLLVGAPFIERQAQVEWVGRSVELALDLGASVVSLIPMRHDPAGVLAELGRRGDFELPDLALLEASLVEAVRIVESRGSATAAECALLVDLWDSQGSALQPGDRVLDRLRSWNDCGRLAKRQATEGSAEP
jgi:radical SAM enzyme (TIGR01210 family)